MTNLQEMIHRAEKLKKETENGCYGCKERDAILDYLIAKTVGLSDENKRLNQIISQKFSL